LIRRTEESSGIDDEFDVARTLEKLNSDLEEGSAGALRTSCFNDWDLMENLRFSNALYCRSLPGEPTSERWLMGWLIRLVKRLIVRIMGWYVNPIVENQRDFNAYTSRTINEMKRYLDHLQINEDILYTIVQRDLALFRANVKFLSKDVGRRIEDIKGEILVSQDSKHDQVEAHDDNGHGRVAADNCIDSMDLLSIAMKALGSPRAVKDFQRGYLKYFEGCSNVIIVGCGRGELIQLLSSQSIPAMGVETNPQLIRYCQERHLDAIQADPVTYLESQADSSVDGIVLSRLSARMSPANFVRLLSACRSKLINDSVLIIEMPSPFSLCSFTNHLLGDSGWVAHLEPEALELLCSTIGFNDPELIFLDTTPHEAQLKRPDLSDTNIEPLEYEPLQAVDSNFLATSRLGFSYGGYVLVTRRSTNVKGQLVRQIINTMT